jgi:hypothetical protein
LLLTPINELQIGEVCIMYVITRNGTFGILQRSFLNEEGIRVAVIKWGSPGFTTTAFWEDIKLLNTAYEGEAREQAEKWLQDTTVNN